MKLAIFDLDGTLFNTKDVNYFAYKEAVEKFGYSMDYRYYCEYCNGKHYSAFLPQITTTEKDVLEKIHAVKKGVYRKYLKKAIPNQNLFDLVRLLRIECKTAIVTTASKKNTEEILNAYSISELFDLVLTQDDIIKVKPNPEGYIKAMDYFKVSRDNTIIFEDSKEGVEAAERSGASVCVVKGFN